MYNINKSSSRKEVLAAVTQNYWVFQFASPELKADRDVVHAAVTQNGYALEYADKSLKADKEVVLAAVKQNGHALEYADESLKADKDFVLAAVKQNIDALHYADESLKADKDLVLAAVKQNGSVLYYADEKLKADSDVVLAAAKDNGLALEYANESLKNDSSFFWQIWNIQKLEKNPNYRKDYIFNYLLKEAVKISLGAIVSGILLSGITIPLIPALIVLIAGAISAIYTGYKVAEHGYGFFTAKVENSTPNIEKDASAIRNS